MNIKFDKVRIVQNEFTLDIDLCIEAGERIALIGPSGAGKSTLLLALAGFVTVAGGCIFLDQTEVSNLPPAERPVTMMFQDHNLFPHLSVKQNVALGLPKTGVAGKGAGNRVQMALAEVELSGLEDKYPGEISGGQQQRVALARALLRNRPVLLLDEPFAALGPALKREMQDLVKHIAGRNKATVIMVTHQPSDAVYFSDKTILLTEGRAENPVETEWLFKHPTDALRRYQG